MKFITIGVVTAFLFLSGCCRYLGVCASASVHTSIAPAALVADQGSVETPEEQVAGSPVALR